MAGDEAYTFGEAECVAETDKAIGVLRDDAGDTEPFWIPKSVIHDDSEVWKKGDEGELVVKYWWAEKNGHA